MTPPQAPRQLLGQLLIGRGVISEDQLRIALHEQSRSNIQLGRLLVQLGFVSEAALREALSESLGKKSVDLEHTIADTQALGMVAVETAKRHCLIPLRWDADSRVLTIAIANTDDIVALDKLRARLPEDSEIETMIASEGEIAQAIDHYYGFELSIDGILTEIETGEIDYQALSSSSDEYNQPIVRLIDALLSDGVKRDASDIHFEPEAGFLRIRYRIDGILRQIRVLHQSYWPAMAVRMKVMASLNIAETRAPQDGRISLNILGREIDFRVSSQPTIHGENIVLRILDRQKGIVPLHQLGLSDSQLEMLKIMIARPEGIILLSGPTGSGKTTTLYSILSHINSEEVNIMTLEDPVEYPMPMIRQTTISEAIKLDFANGIRSMMRQDPDIILVGEIRDSETADMAFRAAMTGHQVYSTLHTNSAVGVIPRLLDIGILPDIMAGNIIGVVAQRLLRKLCPHCRRARKVESFELKLLALNVEQSDCEIFEPVGCEKCSFYGYKGRMAVMELMRMDSDIDELIVKRATYREIRNAARAKGFRTLAEDGTRRVLEGLTSLDELARVVDLTDRMFYSEV